MQNWAQGDFFPFASLGDDIKTKLKSSMPIEKKVNNKAIVVLVSQDCDIYAKEDVEPWLQFVVAEPISNPMPNNCAVRSTRFLVLETKYNGDTYQLKMMKTCFLPKKDFFDNTAIRGDHHSLQNTDKIHLRRWLALRFSRSALPDAFNGKIKPVVESLENYPIDLYIRLADESDGLSEYRVSIIAIPYVGSQLDAESIRSVEGMMSGIVDSIGAIEGIEFDHDWFDENECTLVMDRSEVKLSLLDEFKRWNLDFISLRGQDFSSGNEE